MTSAALSSALPPTPAGTAGRRGSTQAWPVPAPGTSTSGRSSHGSARPGFLRSVGVEILKMRRLRVLLITVLLVIASVAMSSTNLFSQSAIRFLDDPAAKQGVIGDLLPHRAVGQEHPVDASGLVRVPDLYPLAHESTPCGSKQEAHTSSMRSRSASV